MKKIISITLLASAILLAPSMANAQLKRLLKEKALEAVKGLKNDEDKAEPQKQEEPKPNKPAQTGPNFLEKKMMQAMGLSNVKHEQNYTFSSSMVMDIETTDSLSNTQKMEYITYFNNDSKSYAMVFNGVDQSTGQKQKGTMIFDMVNHAMLILSEEDGNKTGVAMVIPSDSTTTEGMETSEIEAAPADFVHPYYKPTGRTKNIAGHSCKEYLYKNTEGRSSIWTTCENKLNISKAYGQMYGMQTLASAGLGFGLGMVMEMETEDYSNGAKTSMKVQELQDNTPKRLDLSGYQIIGMGEGK